MRSLHAYTEYTPVPGATIKVLSDESETAAVIASARSKDDGRFTLECPRLLPEAAVLRISAPGHAPMVYPVGGNQPAWQVLGAVLKQLDRN